MGSDSGLVFDVFQTILTEVGIAQAYKALSEAQEYL